MLARSVPLAVRAALRPLSSSLCLPRGMENSIWFILNLTKTAVAVAFLK